MEGKKGHWARLLAPRTQPLWSFLLCLLLFLVSCLDESRVGEELKKKGEKEKEMLDGWGCRDTKARERQF